MKKNKGLVATAALVIPLGVLAGTIYALHPQLVVPDLLVIAIGIAVITFVYVKFPID
jgi:hypothetical protein